MASSLRNYLTITAAYWGFTITDGAIRMLVVLYFHELGYSPFEIAMLFLFYEFFGVVTNLLGGWLGARFGLNTTLYAGMALQIGALSMLAVDLSWLSVPYVMLAQALSGIAKDLNKMSAKSSVKVMAPEDASVLFKWVSILTGSKNALKGFGFFVGGFLLATVGFQSALLILAGGLAAVMFITVWLLPRDIGRMKAKPKFQHILSKTPAINWLSGARFFLFGSRDVWFVVGLPVFLAEVLDWRFTEVGGFLAIWVIGYGAVQASAPRLLSKTHGGRGPDHRTARWWIALLTLVPALIALSFGTGADPSVAVIAGLLMFGFVFAVNSAVHSYLILAYSEHDAVALNVGFYYMANAGGRLAGTILSGAIYQVWGLPGCLWTAALFLLAGSLVSLKLPPLAHNEGAG